VLKDSLVVDVDADAMGPCLKALEQAVGEIDGVIVTNCFGLAVNIEAYVNFCRRHDKLLVFDNAATPLTRYRGRNVNNYGDACTVSLHHTKPVGFGEGGVVVFRKRYLEAMSRVICFGHSETDKYRYSIHASNYKMSEISAIFASGWLERVGDIREHNNAMLSYFVGEVTRRGVGRRACVYPNFAELVGDTAAAVIPVLFDRPCSVDAFLKEGVDAKKYYYPISEAVDTTPVAMDLFERIVCLPLHLEVSKRDLHKYVAIILDVLCA
jgi:dTDP-4-amino-4,6-dideoxygalactose transaminase